MLRGSGTIELIHAKTGRSHIAASNSNVILQQGARGLSGQAGGINWVPYTQWGMGLGTGYNNLAESYVLPGLDREVFTVQYNDVGHLHSSVSGNSWTTSIDLGPTEANFNLTEAGLFSNGYLNRLMFKSPSVLPAGQYRYTVQTYAGTGSSTTYSAPVQTPLIQLNAPGAITLKWIRNYPSNIAGYLVFRYGPSDGGWVLMQQGINNFFVDAGFIASRSGFIQPASSGFTGPIIDTPIVDSNPKPKAVAKTSEYAARVSITISF